jgi:hypothetical protein
VNGNEVIDGDFSQHFLELYGQYLLGNYYNEILQFTIFSVFVL